MCATNEGVHARCGRYTPGIIKFQSTNNCGIIRTTELSMKDVNQLNEVAQTEVWNTNTNTIYYTIYLNK